MKRFTVRLIVALLTFLAGVGATAGWIIYQYQYASMQERTPPALFSTHTASSVSGLVNSYQQEEELDRVLPQLHAEYVEIKKAPTVEKLVLLDGKIRRLFGGWSECQTRDYDGKSFDHHQYAPMGLYIGYMEVLTYSGKLLADAHRMNPRSKYRKYTLYSTILSDHSPSDLGVMPNIKAAYQYAREFPTGPFIEDTLHIIADFHKDLFMVLRDNHRDYKYDCFKPYITKASYREQMSHAKSVAQSYYQKVLALNPNNNSARESLERINKGKINAWSFCAD